MVREKYAVRLTLEERNRLDRPGSSGKEFRPHYGPGPHSAEDRRGVDGSPGSPGSGRGLRPRCCASSGTSPRMDWMGY